MKSTTPFRRLVFLPLALAALTGLSSLLGQGTFPPEGAPTVPVMKTLQQIEPRIDLLKLAAAAPYTISNPGSYYLTDNIAVTTGHAIVINADHVTLDLGGFAILSAPGNTSGNAIDVNDGGRRHLTIKNGSIAGQRGQAAGFQSGIYSQGIITQALVSDLQISQVSGNGIFLDQQGVVERCTLSGVGAAGIVAEVVRDCSVVSTSDAITARTVANCTGRSTASGIGIKSLIATDSTGTAVSGTGLEAETAIGCTGTSTSGFGLRSLNASYCTGISSGNVGLGWETTNLSSNQLYTNVASHCRGVNSAIGASASAGLIARTADHCYAKSNGLALFALVADTCTAETTTGRYGITTSIAISCVVTGTGNLGVLSPNKYNMP
jgi:hypothetical protein